MVRRSGVPDEHLAESIQLLVVPRGAPPPPHQMRTHPTHDIRPDQTWTKRISALCRSCRRARGVQRERPTLRTRCISGFQAEACRGSVPGGSRGAVRSGAARHSGATSAGRQPGQQRQPRRRLRRRDRGVSPSAVRNEFIREGAVSEHRDRSRGNCNGDTIGMPTPTATAARLSAPVHPAPAQQCPISCRHAAAPAHPCTPAPRTGLHSELLALAAGCPCQDVQQQQLPR
jgi:hypothetical protein